MFLIIGLVVVIGSVIGGYVMHHGKLAVLWQPTEFIIIIGAGIGSMIISNPPAVLAREKCRRYRVRESIVCSPPPCVASRSC